jgi:hypothetical protein
MTKLVEIRNKLSNKILDLRSVERMISSERFERVYENLEDEDKDKLIPLLLSGNRIEVDGYLRKEIKKIKDFDEMSLKELREEAKRQAVINVCKYRRDELIRILIQ